MRILLIVGLVASIHGCTGSLIDSKSKVPDARARTEIDKADDQSVHTENSPKAAPAGANANVQRSDQEAILDAILNDIVNNRTLEHTREFYGSPNSRQLALVPGSGYGITWPAEYLPAIAGWTITRVEEGETEATSEPYFGVRIDKFVPDEEEEDDLAKLIFHAPVEVTIMNASGNKGVIGGCSVYYKPKRDGRNWIVEFMGANDP